MNLRVLPKTIIIVLFIIGCISWYLLQHQNQTPTFIQEGYIIWFILGLTCIGIFNFFIKSAKNQSWLLLLIFTSKLFFCLQMPIGETDMYRYMFDGEIWHWNSNPYQTPPSEIEFLPEEFNPNGESEWINYPQYSSPYPPLLQPLFFLFQFLSQWEEEVWKLLYFVVEIAFCIYLVKKNIYCAVLFSSPLLLWYGNIQGHIEALLWVPMYWVWFHHKKHIVAAILGVLKIWPLLFTLPLLKEKKLFTFFGLGIGTFTSVLFLLQYPINSGLAAYLNHWQMNDWVFNIWEKLTPYDLTTDKNIWNAVLTLLLITIAVKNKTPYYSLFFVFLVLQPCPQPWYFMMGLPLLLSKQSFSSFYFLSLVLPLYATRIYFEQKGMVTLWDNYAPWIEFAPATLLFFKNKEYHQELFINK
jgi:hypothetical protein